MLLAKVQRYSSAVRKVRAHHPFRVHVNLDAGDRVRRIADLFIGCGLHSREPDANATEKASLRVCQRGPIFWRTSFEKPSAVLGRATRKRAPRN